MFLQMETAVAKRSACVLEVSTGVALLQNIAAETLGYWGLVIKYSLSFDKFVPVRYSDMAC